MLKLKEEILTIDKDEVRAIPAFKTILIRDKVRSKPTAFGELLYIYLVHNPKSIYTSLPENERRRRASTHDGNLPSNWTPDKYIQEAEAAYLECLNLSATQHAYTSCSRAIYSIGKDVDLFNEQKIKLRNKLAKVQVELDAAAGERLAQLIDLENTLTTRLMTLTTSIQKVTEGLSNNFSTLESLKKRLADEEGESAEITGGGTLGNREQ